MACTLEPRKARPLIKYAGGKRWSIPILGAGILEYLGRTGGRYIDPFLGGGALALWLGIEDMILGDACQPVIEMYKSVQRAPGGTAWALSALAIQGVDEESYYRVRDMRPSTPVQRAARFLYLNRLAFNGIVRFNKQGAFNVPYAKDTYRISMIERKGRDAITSLFPNKEKFLDVADALRGSELYGCDFRHLCRLAGDGDVLLCDPPYDGTYNSYTAAGFTREDQQRLAAEVRAAADAGAAILVHNAETELIRDYYRWAEFVEVPEKRQINSDTKGRHRVPCVLITNRRDLIDSDQVRALLDKQPASVPA